MPPENYRHGNSVGFIENICKIETFRAAISRPYRGSVYPTNSVHKRQPLLPSQSPSATAPPEGSQERVRTCKQRTKQEFEDILRTLSGEDFLPQQGPFRYRVLGRKVGSCAVGVGKESFAQVS